MIKKLAVFLAAVLLFTIVPTPSAHAAQADLPSGEIQSAITSIAGWYASYSDPLADWDIIALQAAGIDDSRLVAAAGKTPWRQKTASLIADEEIGALPLHLLAGLSSGHNPDLVGKSFDTSPVDLLAQSQTASGSLGAYGMLNEAIYVILVLENTRSAAYDRQAAKTYLLGQQCADGGYTIFGDTGDVDVTGMTLLALSCFQGDPEVDTAIQRAVAFLYSRMTENGGYVSMWATDGAENSNSLCAAISGLVAVMGEDFTSEPQYALMVNNLLSYQRSDGGFAYEDDDAESNYIATYQALIALSDVSCGESWTHRFRWNALADMYLATYSDAEEITGWARGYVASAAGDGLFLGNPDGTFDPKGRLTRGELAAVVCRIAGLKGSVSGTYRDVPADAWYASVISAAVEGGYLTATNGLAGPESLATRAEAAYAIAKLCGLNISKGATEAVRLAGVMTGDPNGRFREKDPMTREEAAKAFLLAANIR